MNILNKFSADENNFTEFARVGYDAKQHVILVGRDEEVNAMFCSLDYLRTGNNLLPTWRAQPKKLYLLMEGILIKIVMC